MISIESVVTCNLNFNNPSNVLFGLKSKKKTQVIFVYCFPVQEETSNFRHQKSCSIYSKCSVEENELTPSFQNLMEEA